MPDRFDQLIEAHGPERVTAALAPLLTDERKARVEQVLDSRLTSLTVALEDLYDPHNGAACVRSVEGFGLSEVHVVEVRRRFAADSTVTIGAQKWLDLHRHPDLDACVSALRRSGFSLCAAVPGAAQTAGDLDPARRRAVFFGNEREGLSPEAIEVCDEQIAIPMHGFTRSFNLSVSVALVVGELARRRRRALAASGGAPGEIPPERRAYLRARWYALGTRGAEEVVRRFVSGMTRE